ncbi:hypothetical protein K474DRAFT_621417 [Panus rudis PR-1116 ss-1]|nr:hypothetical protein K474DRAFT_621417 [Panus rudis PR-1116 ss-1]
MLLPCSGEGPQPQIPSALNLELRVRLRPPKFMFYSRFRFPPCRSSLGLPRTYGKDPTALRRTWVQVGEFRTCKKRYVICTRRFICSLNLSPLVQVILLVPSRGCLGPYLRVSSLLVR